MLKILSTDQIRQADSYTIANEPVLSINLMERAATRCVEWILNKLTRNQHVFIFCGQGNNGGDGLVIARHLAEKDFTVTVYSILHSDRQSPDFLINMERILAQGKVRIHNIRTVADIDSISPDNLIIDALLGSGLTKSLKGLLADCVDLINKCNAPVISIDIPTGLFCDHSIENQNNPAVIKADYTLTFQTPRLSFLFPENEIYVGEWQVLPIGLNEEFLQQQKTVFSITEFKDILQLITPRKRFGHKGSYGHGLLIAGSYGKMGAVVLGAKAALRSGAGLITAHIPIKGYSIVQTAVPEAMVNLDESEYFFSSPPNISPYNAIAAGPGLGTGPESSKALKLLIQNSSNPLILDADALNILSENKTWLAFLPKGSILTPHFKEFERITHKVSNSFDRIELQRELSIKYGIYIILKGANSSISFPDGNIFFNPTGNPGMATGGSGDVLTGILLGLMAQNYNPASVCLIGTYIHGMAGDIAARKNSMQSMIAGDIVDSLGDAFKRFTEPGS
jgi:NAD(P)H-hydrate epimerase